MANNNRCLYRTYLSVWQLTSLIWIVIKFSCLHLIRLKAVSMSFLAWNIIRFRLILLQVFQFVNTSRMLLTILIYGIQIVNISWRICQSNLWSVWSDLLRQAIQSLLTRLILTMLTIRLLNLSRYTIWTQVCRIHWIPV